MSYQPPPAQQGGYAPPPAPPGFAGQQQQAPQAPPVQPAQGYAAPPAPPPVQPAQGYAAPPAPTGWGQPQQAPQGYAAPPAPTGWGQPQQAPQGYAAPAPQPAQPAQPAQQGWGQPPAQGYAAPPPAQPQQAPQGYAAPQPGGGGLASMLQGATMGGDRLPLIQGRGPGDQVMFTLRMGAVRHSGFTTTQNYEILESTNENMPAGMKAQSLHTLGGSGRDQLEARRGEYMRWAVRAFGFDDEASLNANVPNWASLIETNQDTFRGRVIKVAVFDDGTRTKGGEIIWKCAWTPSFVG